MSPTPVNNQSTTVISDWQKRAKSQMQKYLILLIVAVAIATLACVSIFIWFQATNENRIVQQNRKYIEDSAVQESKKLEKDLDEGVILINNLAKQFALMHKQLDNESIKLTLRLLRDTDVFDRIGFVRTDGMDITLEGVTDVKHRNYFKDVMGENHGSGYEFLSESQITGAPTLIFYAPVWEQNADGGTDFLGGMVGFYKEATLDSLFSYHVFNYTPEKYLITQDGTVIAKTTDKLPRPNILEWLKDLSYKGNVNYEQIKQTLEGKTQNVPNAEQNSITFTFVQNGETSIGVISKFTKGSYVLVSILPGEISSTMVDQANSAGRTLLIVVCTIFALMIGLLVGFLFIQNRRLDEEMTAATGNLRKAMLQDERSTYIIESLGDTYSSVYYVQIGSAQYERISEKENSVLDLPATGKWRTGYGNYLTHFVADEYVQSMKRFLDLDRFATTGNDENVGVEYQRKDKGWRKATMIPARIDKNGNVTSLIFAVQKIDAEKKRELETQKALHDAYEAAQLANDAKTTFLSNMSHDIRTPMNAIIGMSSIAAANVDNPEKVADCLKKISSASRHLLGLINEVLDMSKIESGKIDLNEEQFSLSELIDELITINHPLVVEKNHKLNVMIDKLVHENVIGDHIRLQQVFTNLLTNAIKYTPAGGNLSISVSEETTHKPNIGSFKVVFKDNGIGMTEEFQKQLFEPFSRANDDRITSIQGTGLGMPIARNIIRMMNGDITVESTINQGSTFTVTFFLKLQPEKDVDYDRFVNLPVLVVDDELVACESACDILNTLGMKSDFVTSGKKAVEKAVTRHKNKDDYFAVIVDWKMSDMNGIETTKALRKQLGNKLYIVVMSSYDWSDIEQEARSIGVNAFLSKPLFKSKMLNLFSDLMGDVQEGQIVTATTELKQQDYSGKRILLAEDNELNREIACELLGMMGFEIDTAENGKICLDTFEASPVGKYDLIFMDIQMPVMNGYEATKAIRHCTHPQAKSVPIVAMTANAFSTDVQAALDAGMNGHIAKPIDIGIVMNTLKELFD